MENAPNRVVYGVLTLVIKNNNCFLTLSRVHLKAIQAVCAGEKTETTH